MGQPTKKQTEAIQNGDRATFDLLHTQLARRVRGYLQRLSGGNHAAAEDLTQEVFLAAYNGRQHYTGIGQPIAWLLGIARRRWRDTARSAPPVPADLPETAVHPSDVEAQVIRATRLQACLAELDAPTRDAVLLVFGEGWTYAEAAAILGEPIGTVKWRVHSASRALRDRLSSDEKEVCE